MCKPWSAHLLVRSLLAMVPVFAGIYEFTISRREADGDRLMALVTFGPLVAIAGYLCDRMRPRSPLGWSIILWGYNFLIGCMIALLGVCASWFSTWYVIPGQLVWLQMIVLLNSWQILFHVDRALESAQRMDERRPRLLVLRRANGSFEHGGFER